MTSFMFNEEWKLLLFSELFETNFFEISRYFNLKNFIRFGKQRLICGIVTVSEAVTCCKIVYRKAFI